MKLKDKKTILLFIILFLSLFLMQTSQFSLKSINLEQKYNNENELNGSGTSQNVSISWTYDCIPIDDATSLADIDGDGKLEICIVGYNARVDALNSEDG